MIEENIIKPILDLVLPYLPKDVGDQMTSLLTGLNVFTVIKIGFVLFMMAFAYWYFLLSRGTPPGVYGFPILGYFPFFFDSPQEMLWNIAKEYGNIFSVYLGGVLMIVLNDYEAIKEAFIKQSDLFSGRPTTNGIVASPKDDISFVMTDGDLWKEHRRFAIKFFRNAGVGKQSIEPLLMDEIYCYVNHLKKQQGRPTDFRDSLFLSVANNLCIMIFGKRFDYNDTWLLSVASKVDEITKMGNNFSVSVFYPWLSYLPIISQLTKRNKVSSLNKALANEISKIIEERRKSYVDGSEDDYINAYFTEQKENEIRNQNKDVFSDLALVHNVRALLGAGADTTTSTLLWAIIYMMLHPSIQHRVQQEIDANIGSDRAPAWNDRFQTPYTVATIYEIERIATVVPHSLPHRNLKYTTLFGYKIPVNSYIIANIQNVHNDQALWTDPENFRPERFISIDGKADKPEYLIPFSAGKRQCVGESIARTELYLYFVTLLQHFTFKSPEGTTPSLDANAGVTSGPKNFLTCAIPREK